MSHVKPLPQKSWDQILDVIKCSNLHFKIQETPDSAYITIRKSLFDERDKNVSIENFLKEIKDNPETIGEKS